MSAQTRSYLQNLLANKVISGNNATTAQNIRDFENDIIDSMINKIDDANANNGYMAIDNNGIANQSKIKKLTPTGQFLRDDGSWQTISIIQSTFNTSISANTLDLSAQSGEVIVNVQGSGSITIDKIINYTNVTKIILRPKTGIDLTINDGSVSTFVGVKLAAPTLVVYGTKFGFLELTKRNDGSQDQLFQTNFIDQYT